MKESRKPLEERIGYKIWSFIDNHTYIFLTLMIALTMGITYLAFSISQQEAYEIALASYDRGQYESLDEVITKNMQNGFPNISEIPENIEFEIEKRSDSDEIRYTFSKEVKDRKSWLIPDLTIRVKMSKSGELLSKTSYYETEESYIQNIHSDYRFCKFFVALLGCIPTLLLIMIIMLPFCYYWENKKRSKEYAELQKRLAVWAMDVTSEDDEQEEDTKLKLIEDETEDNDE